MGEIYRSEGGEAMTEKFTFIQRETIKQLVIEADVQRFTEAETLAYIKSRMQMEISPRYLYNVKAIIRQNIASRLKKLREHKTMFINELFFKRRDELEKYQQELWRIYHTNPRDGHLQAECIRELHKVTVTLCQIYSELPMISGMTFFTTQQQGGGYNNGEKTISGSIGAVPNGRQSNEKRADGSDVYTDGSDYKPVV